MTPLAKTVLKRLGLLLLTLVLVTALAFLAFSIVPGDPTSSIVGVDATEEQIATVRAQLGLDLPIWQRYLSWVGSFITGDFGQSYNFDMPVADLLAPRIGVTLTLGITGIVLLVAEDPVPAAPQVGTLALPGLTRLQSVIQSRLSAEQRR